VSLVYAEETIPRLSSLCLRGSALCGADRDGVAQGRAAAPRGWLGLLLGFAGLGALLWPSLRAVSVVTERFCGHRRSARRALFCLRKHLVPPRQAQGERLCASAGRWLPPGLQHSAGTALGNWPRFHVNAASVGSLAYLVTGGSLLDTQFHLSARTCAGSQGHVYTYINPVVAVLLGIFLLHERPGRRSSRAWQPSSWLFSFSLRHMCVPRHATARRGTGTNAGRVRQGCSLAGFLFNAVAGTSAGAVSRRAAQ